MSHVDPGPLASYNSLSDPNLTAYFSNSRMRKHLIKTGLVTRKGEIVSEKVYRLNNARKEHQRHVRDLLAQAIVHKALDMERHRQMQIKKQLEEIGKVERVRRVRADRALRGDEDILPLLSAPDRKPGLKPERPHTAPTTRTVERPTTSTTRSQQQQLPQSVGYPAIPGDSPYNTRSTRITTPYPNVEVDNQYLSQLDQEALRTFTLNLSNYDLGSGVSPYVVPVLDPASRDALEKIKPTTKKRRKFKKRPATAPASSRKSKEASLTPRSNKHSLELHRREPPMIYRKQPRSLCLITFKYLGQIVHLDREQEDPRDEIMVDQQHCGGGNLCVYRGKMLPGNNFTIISQRHRGYPFSLTFYLNGIIVERLSACCEYKHKKGSKLGAKSSHFGFVKIEGVHPCYKCLVATEKFRTTSDQSALAKNTFRKHGEPEKPPQKDDSSKKAVKKILEEPTYEDSFATTDSEDSSSSASSSISSLTPADEEKSDSDSEVSSRTPEKVSSGSRSSSSTKSSSQKSSKTASSASGLSDSTVEGNKSRSPSRAKLESPRPKKDKSPVTTSSGSTSSDDEEEKVGHPEPTPLNFPIKSVSKQREKIDLSHFALTSGQVDELCEVLTDDSPSIRSLILYNCELSAKKQSDILKAVTSFCKNIKTVNLGRNKGLPLEDILDLVEKTELENLVLDDTSMSSSKIKKLMDGLTAQLNDKPAKEAEITFSSAKLSKVISLSGSRPGSGSLQVSSNSFNQMTLMPSDSPTSSDTNDFCLQLLSLNRVGLDKEGITAIGNFLVLNPPLVELEMNGNSLSGDTLMPLWRVLGSGKNTHLTTLSLSSNRVNDDSIESFANVMAQRSALEKVVFTKNSITESGAAHVLKFAKNNNAIKHIVISQGNSIKRKTLKQLRKVLSPRRSK